jgi:hypothetical protein
MENIKEIKQKFGEMQSKQDFVALLNYVRPSIFKTSEYSFSEKQINYFINTQPKRSESEGTLSFELLKEFGVKMYGGRYKSFDIKKKTRGHRTIHAPNRGLKAIQKCLNYILQAVYNEEIHTAANGFVLGKSIVDNASMHVQKNYVYNIDLKDFFPSIDKRRVYLKLLESPFNLRDESRSKIANMIAILCCHEFEVERTKEGSTTNVKEWVLPQGAPTSPILSNIVCKKLDLRLARAARNHGVNYTRYADDITFSSMHNVYQEGSQFLEKVKQIILEQHFEIKASKTRLQKQGEKQEVTGLIVNDKVNVSQKYIKELRHWLYLWERYGKIQAETLFGVKYLRVKGQVKSGKPNMTNVVYGKLQFLKMVKGHKNSTYVALNDRFLKLTDGKKGKELTNFQNNNGIQNQESNKNVKNDLPKYLRPTILAQFLLAYNQHPVLKYTCHEIDDITVIEQINRICKTQIYDITKHQELISQSFAELYENYTLSPNVWSRIDGYLNGNSNWSAQNIEISWRSPELVEWAQKNMGIVPNPGLNLINHFQNKGFKFKDAIKINLTGQKINTFSKLVIYFKHLFHLRGDNSLKQLIVQINEYKKWNDQIDFDINHDGFMENLELFTDVDKLIQAYNSLIKMILEVVQELQLDKPKVKIWFKVENSNEVIFAIHHINSIFKRSPTDLKKRPGERETLLIKNQINGLCDLYLKAHFEPNTYAEINLWNGKKREETNLDNFDGVMYILKFPK